MLWNNTYYNVLSANVVKWYALESDFDESTNLADFTLLSVIVHCPFTSLIMACVLDIMGDSMTTSQSILLPMTTCIMRNQAICMWKQQYCTVKLALNLTGKISACVHYIYAYVCRMCSADLICKHVYILPSKWNHTEFIT